MLRFGKRLAALLLAAAVLALSAGFAEEEEETTHQVVFRSVGQVVTLGRYEQDGNAGNGPEPVEWIIVEMKEGRCLLLSRYALDVRPYHTESAAVTWEQCSLRSWLNGEFLDSAFTDRERSAILPESVDNSASQGYRSYGTSGGNSTMDHVFLLSWSQADAFFSGNLGRLCAPTVYALSLGAWTSRSYLTDGKPACCWWLRSPGLEQSDAMCAGNIAVRRRDVAATDVCVRPALWISLYDDVI